MNNLMKIKILMIEIMKKYTFIIIIIINFHTIYYINIYIKLKKVKEILNLILK